MAALAAGRVRICALVYVGTGRRPDRAAFQHQHIHRHHSLAWRGGNRAGAARGDSDEFERVGEPGTRSQDRPPATALPVQGQHLPRCVASRRSGFRPPGASACLQNQKSTAASACPGPGAGRSAAGPMNSYHAEANGGRASPPPQVPRRMTSAADWPALNGPAGMCAQARGTRWRPSVRAAPRTAADGACVPRPGLLSGPAHLSADQLRPPAADGTSARLPRSRWPPGHRV